jgi:cytochrome c-type biogenesis protein
MSNIPFLFAFSAGIISFLAPCVLPLIPGYIAYLAGINIKEANAKRSTVVINAVFFVIGFALVFALLGVLLNTLFEAFAYDAQLWFSRVGGIIVIFFGLYLTGLFHIPFLEREHKVHFNTQNGSRYISSLLFGAAFAAGWTPCAGAALGGILGLAATQPGTAFPLLLTYAIGFGLPFIVLSAFLSQARPLLQRLLPYIRTLNLFFGVLLVAFGILLFTQTLTRFVNFEYITRWLGN